MSSDAIAHQACMCVCGCELVVVRRRSSPKTSTERTERGERQSKTTATSRNTPTKRIRRRIAGVRARTPACARSSAHTAERALEKRAVLSFVGENAHGARARPVRGDCRSDQLNTNNRKRNAFRRPVLCAIESRCIPYGLYNKYGNCRGCALWRTQTRSLATEPSAEMP